MRRLTILLAPQAAVAIMVAGCGGSTNKFAVDTTTAKHACRKLAAYPKMRPQMTLAKPTFKLDPSKTWKVDFETNCGPFTVTLDPKLTPALTASFVSLIRHRFYDGLHFDRSAGSYIEGGGQLGTASGPGYVIYEQPLKTTRYLRGTVAMDGGESQFFIVTGKDAGFAPSYNILGYVTKGMDAVNAMAAIPVSTADPIYKATGGPPQTPIVYSKVTVHN
jgi:cyclophilin family peptidyl-prolyl cis-trans isomerase